jgi:hypothetical protein
MAGQRQIRTDGQAGGWAVPPFLRSQHQALDLQAPQAFLDDAPNEAGGRRQLFLAGPDRPPAKVHALHQRQQHHDISRPQPPISDRLDDLAQTQAGDPAVALTILAVPAEEQIVLLTHRRILLLQWIWLQLCQQSAQSG